MLVPFPPNLQFVIRTDSGYVNPFCAVQFIIVVIIITLLPANSGSNGSQILFYFQVFCALICKQTAVQDQGRKRGK